MTTGVFVSDEVSAYLHAHDDKELSALHHLRERRRR